MEMIGVGVFREGPLRGVLFFLYRLNCLAVNKFYSSCDYKRKKKIKNSITDK